MDIKMALALISDAEDKDLAFLQDIESKLPLKVIKQVDQYIKYCGGVELAAIKLCDIVDDLLKNKEKSKFNKEGILNFIVSLFVVLRIRSLLEVGGD